MAPGFSNHNRTTGYHLSIQLDTSALAFPITLRLVASVFRSDTEAARASTTPLLEQPHHVDLPSPALASPGTIPDPTPAH